MAKKPGLTEAMERDLRLVAQGNSESVREHGIGRLFDAGLVDFDENITPRGQAALAAPRVTAAELEYMDVTMNEGTPSPNTAMAKRIIAKGWAQYTPGLWVQFTSAGRTANNVRAASGSAEWKEAK